MTTAELLDRLRALLKLIEVARTEEAITEVDELILDLEAEAAGTALR